MADHWWQRPGRLPGRELYHWHMLFHDQPEVHELAAMAQQRLAGLPGLDMVPRRWLHLTTFIVGFADEIPRGRIETMAAEARRGLAAIAPIPVTLGRVLYHPQAIALALEPLGALDPVLDAVRAATRAAGCEGRTDTNPWIPHISVAYSHACGPAAPIIEALGRWLPKTEITLGSISLVAQTQVGSSWQWRQTAELQLSGTSVTPSPSPDDAASEPVHAPGHWWWRG
jgi:2'-5' RNA ligase